MFKTLLIFLVSSMVGIPMGWAQRPNDWVAIKDHKVVVENTGWAFPVEIAFVPQPGADPKAPLYYVSELRGTIKVVTNDRTVLTYAEKVNTYRPPTELPNELAEVGLAGICLDPQNGYLFATTAYYRDNTFYNKIVRFEHETTAFAVKPKTFVEFTEIFDNDESTNSHQIGKCVIGQDRKLYVGVGDGHAPYKVQGLDNPNGKILRLNLDGSAPEDNPFYNPQTPNAVAGFIWAYGLRNPFAITLDDQGILYITDNGPNRDRLIEGVAGKNYLWDGTNESMKGDGIWHWHGSVSPAGAIYLGKATQFLYWQKRVVVAQAGSLEQPGPSKRGRVTINSFAVLPGRGLQAKPETLVWFQGNYLQILVPLAEGPDGIYFSGFFPDPDNQTAIFKLVRQEGAVPDLRTVTGADLFESKGCVGCHKLHGKGGDAGPPIDGLIDRLQQVLHSDAYAEQLETTDQLTSPVHVKYRDARQQLRALAGEAKIEFWIRHRLEEPRFDRELSQMPNLALTPEEIEPLTTYLLTLKNPQTSSMPLWETWHRRFKIWWDTDYNARPTVGFIAGALFVLILQWLLRKLWRMFVNKGT